MAFEFKSLHAVWQCLIPQDWSTFRDSVSKRNNEAYKLNSIKKVCLLLCGLDSTLLKFSHWTKELALHNIQSNISMQIQRFNHTFDPSKCPYIRYPHGIVASWQPIRSKRNAFRCFYACLQLNWFKALRTSSPKILQAERYHWLIKKDGKICWWTKKYHQKNAVWECSSSFIYRFDADCMIRKINNDRFIFSLIWNPNFGIVRRLSTPLCMTRREGLFLSGKSG